MKLHYILPVLLALPVSSMAFTLDLENIKPYGVFSASYTRLGLNEEIGKEIEFFDIDTKDILNPNGINFNLALGLQLNNYVSAEVFYQKMIPAESEIEFYVNDQYVEHYTSKFSFSALGGDFLFYLPIENTKFSFIGTVGLARYSGKLNSKLGSADIKSEDGETAFRFGVGGQLSFDENFAIRGIIRYVPFDKGDDVVIEDMIEASIGARVTF